MVDGKGEGGKNEGANLKLQLFLGGAAGVLGVLAAHGPGADGEAIALGLDGIDLFVC